MSIYLKKKKKRSNTDQIATFHQSSLEQPLGNISRKDAWRTSQEVCKGQAWK